MKKIYFLLFSGCCIFQRLYAQLPEDALRLSWTAPSGTARQQAIGGAMGSLGGDISSIFVNPAGLGIYKTSEIVISPGFRYLKDKNSYLGMGASGSAAKNFNLGTSGFVLGWGTPTGSGAFGLAVNRMANFGSHLYYKGQNSYSSGAEQYSEEFSNSHLGIDEALGTTALTYATRMALYTSLIDTVRVNGGDLEVIAQPQKTDRVDQEMDLRTSGGITEIALSLAGNSYDKWYFGGSLGLPIINYSRTTTYRESDASGNTNNDFDSYTYREDYSAKGFGLNLKMGAIFRPTASWRVGLAIHTPTISGITEKISGSMIARTEGYTSLPQVSINTDTLDQLSQTSARSFDYDQYTPWKFIVSGSWLFGGAEQDTRRQKGFISADIEYVTINSSRFRPGNDNTDPNYFDDVNNTIKSYYKGSIGAHLGGEMKFNTLMARAGVAYYTSPYRDSQLKADKLFVSAGLGYRNKGMFVDLAYVAGFSKDINFPYRLSDKDNVFASLKETSGTALLTVGFKF